jgi:HEAT repeat protein
MRRFICFFLVFGFAAFAGGASHADPMDDLAKETKIPRRKLEEVAAERLFHKDPHVRGAIVKELADTPRPAYLPLLVRIARKPLKSLNDPDWPMRLTAAKVLSVPGLLASRKSFDHLVFPAIKANFRDPIKSGQLKRASMEELNRFNRWFRRDKLLIDFYKEVFEGDDYNLSYLAFYGMLDLKNAKIQQEVVLPAIRRVITTKKYGVFQRRRAIRELANRGDRELLPWLQKRMVKEATIAIACCRALGKLLDQRSVKALRKIKPKAAVHRLLRPAWWARGRLQDKSLLKLVPRIMARGHRDMKQALLEAVGEIDDPRVVPMLKKILSGSRDVMVRRSVALGLLKRKDGSGVDVLEEVVSGGNLDPSIARKILYVNDPVTTPLLKAIIANEQIPEQYEDIRLDAVSLVGERQIGELRDFLKSLYFKYDGLIKFHLAISLYELGETWIIKEKNMVWWLGKFEDHERWEEDRYWTVMGRRKWKVKRFRGDAIIDAMRKFKRTRRREMLPFLRLLLKKRGKGEPIAEGTVTRDREYENPYFVTNPFVRREVVETAALIGGKETLDLLQAALEDESLVVRAAALRGVGDVTGAFRLEQGATEQEEEAALTRYAEWRKSHEKAK